MAEMAMLWALADAAARDGDHERAKALYERGAGLGDSACWVGLGFMFDTGQGVEVDKERALQCYRAAWRSRDPAAANNIAVLYREKGDRRAMFRWFKRAAEQGDDGAYLDLAKCYREGVGVRKSLDEALRCLARVMAGSCVSEAERDEARELLAQLRPRAV
jgi:TPR repeat protein